MAENPDFLKRTHQCAAGSIPYRIHIPETVPEGGFPLVLFLHGMGERGTDNEKQLIHGARDILSYCRRVNVPTVILAPQCPDTGLWVEGDYKAPSFRMPEQPSKAMSLVINLLEKVIEEQQIDRTRIYLTGLSMGGYGTWDLLIRRHGMFAAAIPVCGGGDPSKASCLASTPIWAFHGGADPVVPAEQSRNMVNAVNNAGGSALYTEYEGVGHNAWTPTYTSDKVLSWLFGQKKKVRNSSGDLKITW